MIVQLICKTLYPSYTQTLDKYIQIWKNINGFVVCCFTFYSLYKWHDIGEKLYLDRTVKLIYYQTIADLPLARIDVFIHHIAVLMFVYIYHNSNFEIANPFIASILLSEVSTIFLISKDIPRVLIKWYPEKKRILETIEGLNVCLFIISFFYFRIYYYAITILYRCDVCTKIDLYEMEITGCYITIFMFYALNGYWVVFIMKKAIHYFTNERLIKTG